MPDATPKTLWIKIDPTTGKKYLIVDDQNRPIKCEVCPCTDCDGVKLTVTITAASFPQCDNQITQTFSGTITLGYIQNEPSAASFDVPVVIGEPTVEGPYETLTVAAGTTTWTVACSTGGCNAFAIPVTYGIALPACTEDGPLGGSFDVCVKIPHILVDAGSLCYKVTGFPQTVDNIPCTECADPPKPIDPTKTYGFYLFSKCYDPSFCSVPGPSECGAEATTGWHRVRRVCDAFHDGNGGLVYPATGQYSATNIIDEVASIKDYIDTQPASVANYTYAYEGSIRLVRSTTANSVAQSTLRLEYYQEFQDTCADNAEEDWYDCDDPNNADCQKFQTDCSGYTDTYGEYNQVKTWFSFGYMVDEYTQRCLVALEEFVDEDGHRHIVDDITGCPTRISGDGAEPGPSDVASVSADADVNGAEPCQQQERGTVERLVRKYTKPVPEEFE